VARLVPIPQPGVPVLLPNGGMRQEWYEFFRGLFNLNPLTDASPFVTYSTTDSQFARLDTEDQTLAGGARVTVKALGTITTGTVTPDPGDRPMQSYTNGGAHTLAPGTNIGAYWIIITNNGSAGAITTSGFTKVTGDAFTTTNGHIFFCAIVVTATHSLLQRVAMQ